MVGLCGTIGGSTQYLNLLTEAITWLDSDESTNYADESVGVGYADHPIEFDEQPATTGDVAIWCWGDVIGHEYKRTYTPRAGDLSDAEYCAELYERHGLNFIAGLNSEFAGVIYDRSDETVSIFTDRLGSRPIYYTHTSDDSLVFSSLLQTIGVHPDVELDADPAYLAEYFTYSRVFGTKTPASGVYTLPPASITTFDLNGEMVNRYKYWWPVPRERDLSYSAFTEQFSKVLRTSINERKRSERDHGLLLSGGSDSRLVLETLGSETTAFHMNEYLDGNREAQTAKQVAEIKHADFRFLKRDSDYYPSVFTEIQPIYNFNGLFHHANAAGFTEQIREEVDELFCGQYSDTIVGGTYVPKFLNDVSVLRHLIPLYRAREIDHTREYITALERGEMGDYNGLPTYLQNAPHTRTTIDSEIHRRRGRITHHGVSYPSWRSLVKVGAFYPITNVKTFVFYETLNQALPTKYPFLDNRVIDLALQMPDRYLYQRSIVENALKKQNPELAAVPHPTYRIGPENPYYVKHFASKANALKLKIQRTSTSGDSSSGHVLNPNGSSWPNYGDLIRHHEFIENSIEKSEEMIGSSTYLDPDAVEMCFEEHMNGKDRTHLLYALASVLISSLELTLPDESDP